MGPDFQQWESEDGGRFFFLPDSSLPPVPAFQNIEKKMPSSVYASTAEKNREKLLEMMRQHSPVMILQEDINKKQAVLESIRSTKKSRKKNRSQSLSSVDDKKKVGPTASTGSTIKPAVEEKKKARLSMSFKKSSPVVAPTAAATPPPAKKLDVDVDEYKRQMIKKYEDEQTENARRLTAMKNAAPPPPFNSGTLRGTSFSSPPPLSAPPPPMSIPPPPPSTDTYGILSISISISLSRS